MKAQELRKGNLLQGKTVVKVSGITTNNYVSIENNSSLFIVEGDAPCLTPIPLTEEWLISFGFKKWNTKDNSTTYSKGVLILHLRKRGWVINKRFAEPKHVHQLQNLYFALTGEELNIINKNLEQGL